MGAFDESWVDGDDFKETTEGEFLFQEEFGDLEFWELDRGVDEEFAGIVAGLAVDIDGACEVGGFCVVGPVVVGEPGVGFGHDDEVAGAGVVLRADLVDAGGVLEEGPDFIGDGRVVDVDVGDLVVGDGEGLATAIVEGFAAEFVFDREPAFLAEEAVEMDWAVDRGDPVFGKEEDLDVTGFVVIDQFRDDAVDGSDLRRDVGCVGSVFLQAVVEVGEVDEGECWRVFLFHPFCGSGDPFRGGDAGGGAPEGWERERAKVGFELITHAHGLGVDVKVLRAIRRIEEGEG